ncbi:hypothetical protein TVAG_000350 [Trichomonas vaginalis G3]|uniref:Uncharacterized protein n=1 Tax=Trichomonas vaginalis (strain ATCC PRA-98 / G3) TaxID=412133 RepID=A2EHR1_TRIV3|nr:hypothetical protein TVAGG3_0077350 [Trichomonas vaginalis G3]EAY07751.1 hypothetical protein TVAG_000350 [Trichomonas vaginalis G3]KAI5542979.1 hypothetical protein TVAGG3_0077350 [Trichomonas vaginalis G3]|eukprot:XP_001319974.1 hypothetical protein [Trichomonas vaginalis G3]
MTLPFLPFLLYNKYRFLESEWLISEEDGLKKYALDVSYDETQKEYRYVAWKNYHENDGAQTLQAKDAIVFSGNFTVTKTNISGKVFYPQGSKMHEFSTVIDDKGNESYNIQLMLSNYVSVSIRLTNISYAEISISQLGSKELMKFTAIGHPKHIYKLRLTASWITYFAVTVFLLLQIRSMIKLFKQSKEDDLKTFATQNTKSKDGKNKSDEGNDGSKNKNTKKASKSNSKKNKANKQKNA